MIEIRVKSVPSALVRVALPLSKSELNRQLILAALAGSPSSPLPDNAPEDIRILSNALHSSDPLIDIGHAGTAMRFSTAYMCTIDRNCIIQGSERMHQRPIAKLADALQSLGADIEYLSKEGFPPLRINHGSKLGGEVTISGAISSQYISAVLLCAARMPMGLLLHIAPPITSAPYIDLTLEIMAAWALSIPER